MKKASHPDQATKLEQIPNVGPAIAADFRLIGILRPQDLKGQDPLKLYHRLNKLSGCRHDPCVLDTFMAAVHFMEKGEALAWWAFTPQRKKPKLL